MDDLHTFSHDVRNVLSIMYANAEVLEATLKDSGQEDLRAMAHEMLESAQRIEALIREHLDAKK